MPTHSDPRAEAVTAAAIAVHQELGPGHLEEVYRLALRHELRSRGVPFAADVDLPIWYKGHRLAARHRAGLVCHGDLLIEVKALPAVGRVEVMEAANHLAGCRKPAGLVLNFGAQVLQVRHVAGPIQEVGPVG